MSLADCSIGGRRFASSFLISRFPLGSTALLLCETGSPAARRIETLCYNVDTMSNPVGIRELRQQASSLLKRVVRGEVIEVTDHGHPIARIVPLRPGVLDQLVLEGRATESSGDLLELVTELGLPVQPSASLQPPSEALAELRADER